MAVTDDQIDDLFSQWLEACRVYRHRRRELAAATALLPWWVQPGRPTLHSDGSFSGALTWTPAIVGTALPVGSVRRLLRPSEIDFRRHMASNPFGSEAYRQAILDKQLAGLAERQAAQAVEMKKAGADVLRMAEQAEYSRICRLVSQARRLGPSPAFLAFDAIFDIVRLSWGPDCFAKQYRHSQNLEVNDLGDILRNLVEILPPILRAAAERILKPGAGPMSKIPFWIGREPYTGGGDRPADEVVLELREAA